jgi:hypothetical protein
VLLLSVFVGCFPRVALEFLSMVLQQLDDRYEIAIDEKRQDTREYTME